MGRQNDDADAAPGSSWSMQSRGASRHAPSSRPPSTGASHDAPSEVRTAARGMRCESAEVMRMKIELCRAGDELFARP